MHFQNILPHFGRHFAIHKIFFFLLCKFNYTGKFVWFLSHNYFSIFLSWAECHTQNHFSSFNCGHLAIQHYLLLSIFLWAFCHKTLILHPTLIVNRFILLHFLKCRHFAIADKSIRHPFLHLPCGHFSTSFYSISLFTCGNSFYLLVTKL